MSRVERERTPTELVMYALYLYFLGLSFRNTSKALEPFREKRSHVAVWNWVQRFNPKSIYSRKRVTAFVIDETMIQVGGNEAWLWIAIEPVRSTVLVGVYFLSRHRDMLIDESFLRSLIKIYGRHTVYSDDGCGTWYPEACSSFPRTLHRLHTSFLKKASLKELSNTLKIDRTEHFDDYHPCIRFGCDNLSHVYKWLAGPICIYA